MEKSEKFSRKNKQVKKATKLKKKNCKYLLQIFKDILKKMSGRHDEEPEPKTMNKKVKKQRLLGRCGRAA